MAEGTIGLRRPVMDDDRTLGEVLHGARIKHNPPLERPRGVPPWDERAEWQRDLDEAMAADLAAVVTERVAAGLDCLAGSFPPDRRTAFRAAAESVRKGTVSVRKGTVSG